MGGQIIVSGGAGYWTGPEGAKLDAFVLSLTRKRRPRICALCTASGDSARYIEGFYDNFRESCEVSHLPHFEPPFASPESSLRAQDVIYVGGGTTANMLAIWRLHGIQKLLRKALDNGSILYGSSAGGLCWLIQE
jgi:dipeptidase E